MRVISGQTMHDIAKKFTPGSHAGYFMVETSENLYAEDDTRLMDAVEVVQLIQSVYKVNKILKNLGESQMVDVEVFQRVIDRILNPEFQLSEVHVERFYSELKKLEKFSRTVEAISTIQFNLTSRIEYTVLGLSYKEIIKIRKSTSNGDFDEAYFNFYVAYVQGRMEYSKFIYSVRSYLATFEKILKGN
ncbi:hypothetical protein [Flagellimonas allohymeniacidonis]|uniref:Uncharacterized protein n=1 Tax=Flagellimonas allohymeniacidonis TaxID=2517819 RepID=A0A4Q8QGF7_9FLAO|nr:hypothetical protein [Allomuricauda hymeniacidonis]TAI48984.1 hypothetical protein EW142_04090 [Allomuricauda hymeniacidonis]